MKIELDAVNRHRKEPLHKQLKEIIRGAINAGIYKPGQQIESEQQFIKVGKFSNRTVARAFRDLVAEGRVIRKRGLGTFAAQTPSAPNPSLNTLGVVYKDTTDEIFLRIFKGIEYECRFHHVVPLPFSIGFEEGAEDRLMRELEKNKVKGIMAIPDMGSKKHRELMRLILSHMPVVLMDSYLPEIISDAVVLDNKNSSFQIVQHLVEMGHERIAFISCPFRYPYYTSIRDRITGVKNTLDQLHLGLDDDCLIILPPKHTREIDVKKAVISLLDRPPDRRPTAIICVHDRLALDVLRVLQNLKVSVPQQVSLASYDDMSFAADLDPPLTTIRQPRERLGREAASLFFDRLMYPDRQCIRIVLDTTLIIRQSTCPPITESYELKLDQAG